MKEALLLSRTAGEVRVALVEEGRATAFYIDRERDRGAVGNVYIGRVVRVLPGMQAAFLDIGADRSVFLYVGDIVADRVGPPREPAAPSDPDPDAEDTIGVVPLQRPTFLPDLPDPSPDGGLAGGATVADTPIPRSRPLQRIEQLLRPGQELVVQISKAAMGTKGARVTTQLSLPGRFLVHLAHADHVGISRRITDESRAGAAAQPHRRDPRAGRGLHRAHRLRGAHAPKSSPQTWPTSARCIAESESGSGG